MKTCQYQRDPILSTPRPQALQNIVQSETRKGVFKAAGKAEELGIQKEAGTGAISLAIGFINDIKTTKELIDSIIGEAEEILKTGGIGGWKMSS